MSDPGRGLAVRPGDPAPDFTLPSTGGGTVTLSQHRGAQNVLLAFFPLAFTRVCTAELCAFTEDFDRFASATTQVYGVSVDSVPTLSAFRREHKIGVDLLSDFRRDVCRRYGTLLEEEFFSRRAYVLVDRAGTVRWAFAEAQLGDRRENAELLARVRELE
jgi:peroxiredoxin